MKINNLIVIWNKILNGFHIFTFFSTNLYIEAFKCPIGSCFRACQASRPFNSPQRWTSLKVKEQSAFQVVEEPFGPAVHKVGTSPLSLSYSIANCSNGWYLVNYSKTTVNYLKSILKLLVYESRLNFSHWYPCSI